MDLEGLRKEGRLRVVVFHDFSNCTSPQGNLIHQETLDSLTDSCMPMLTTLLQVQTGLIRISIEVQITLEDIVGTSVLASPIRKCNLGHLRLEGGLTGLGL